jgi:hypothetical protein
MRLQLPPLGPVIGLVVVVDVAEKEACIAFMNDQPNIAARPHRPEVLVSRFIELVEAHAGVGGVDLQVESGRFDGFLLLAGQASEAISESVGDTEVHVAATV